MTSRSDKSKLFRVSDCPSPGPMGSLTILSKLSRVFAASRVVQRPAVGVGVVIFRPTVAQGDRLPQVLLIRRGKAPSKGMISFPGGRQELGETVIECAIREAKEECGIDLRHDPSLLRNVERIGATRVPTAFLQYRTLEHPVPFTAVDVMAMSEEDAMETELEKMMYHFAIIEVAATVADPGQEPVAADDADEAFWWDCDDFLKSDNPDIVPNLKHVVETALSMFEITRLRS